MNCESGEACNAALGASGSNAQGAQFLSMHTQHHGGKRSRRSHRSRRQRGGAVAELPTLEQAFEPSLIPAALHASAGVAPLDQANAQLAQFKQMGGRRTRRSGGALGMGPAEHGGPLIPAEMEQYTFQNPQWYEENLVNPMFVGPTVAKVGGAKKSRKSRKSRKASRKVHRKAHRKNSRKQKGGKSRKSRKAQRKHRK